MGNEFLLYKDTMWKPYKSFDYTGEVEEFSLSPGTYLFAAHGAKGGNSEWNATRPWGGATYGILDLDHEQTFYAAVGGNGENTSRTNQRPKGGFNGGGNGGLSVSRSYQNGAGGGGATDVRIRNDGIIVIDRSTHTLPEGIEEVEYIQSDGTQYIYTDVIHKADTHIECVCSVSNRGNGYEAIFGSRSPQLVLFTRFASNNNINFAVATLNDTQSVGPAMTYDKKLKIVVDKNNVTMYDMDGVEVLTYTNPATQVDGAYPLLLFDLNSGGYVDNSKTAAKIYSFKMMNNGVLVRDMVPFKNTGGVPMDTSDVVFEQGTIYTTGDASSVSRVRSVGYIDVDPAYPYMSGLSNDLQVSIMEYDENKTCIVDGAWQTGGTISRLNANTKFIRIVLRYSDDRNFDPSVVTSFSLNKHLTTASSGLYDAVEGKIYAKSSGNDFTVGPALIKRIDSGLYSRIFVAGGGGGAACQSLDSNGSSPPQDFLSFGGGPVSSWVTAGSSPTSANWAYICANQNQGASFGIGANAEDRINTGSSTYGMEGQSGGGGGWYGGYALRGMRNSSSSYTASNGSGGSSYVLTESSYKPDEYMYGVEDLIPSLYFRDFMMLPCQAFDGPSLIIYKEASVPPVTSDILKIPYTGERQKFSLLPGSYRIKCYGGDGGTRQYAAKSAKGGYAEGVLNILETTTLYGYVGSSSHLVGIGTTSGMHDLIFNNRMAFNVKIGDYSTERYGATAGGGATDIRIAVPKCKIPDEYDQVEYIESNSTQYIDLNHIFNANTSKYEVVASMKDPSSIPSVPNWLILFGQRDPSATNMIMLLFRDNGENKTVVGIGNSYYYGTVMPFDTKIRIVATGKNPLTWYDMNGTQIGSLNIGNWSFTSPLSTYLFCYNESGHDAGKVYAKIYSFKIYENNILKRYYLPFKSKPDAEEQICGLYDIINGVAYTSPKGDPFVCGDVVEKTEYENEETSLLSRIIVAGGGGGQGAPGKFGGTGGGTSGAWFSGDGYGTNNGPGTQNSTPAQSTAGGGFGYNGVGTYNNGGFGGSGGNGWFGGNGTDPDGSGDDDKAGCGGSGYVLTESSYKPAGYIPDSRYWMTETMLTQGGNPTRNMTKIEISVENVSAAYIIAHDEDSYKSYDKDNNEWIPIEVDELTPSVFEEYGAMLSIITTDKGLTSRYMFYVYDKYEIGVDSLKTLVLPLTQSVKLSEKTQLEILESVIDYDKDENTDISMTYNISGTAEKRAVDIDISIDMKEIPVKNNTIYSIQFNTRKKSSSHYYPTKPEKTIDDLDLLYVGSSESVLSRYKTHIGGFMPDGTTPITSTPCSSSCEYKRNIYTATILNGSVIRITRFDVVANKSYIIRDNIPRTALDTYENTLGSLLIDDNYMYLISSRNDSYYDPIRVLCVPFDQSISYATYTAPVYQSQYSGNGYGAAEWFSPNEILVMSMYGFVVFNTKTHGFSYKVNDSGFGIRNDMSFGKNILICHWYNDDCGGPRRYNKTTFEYYTTSLSFTFEKGKKVSCYDDGKFYITMKGHLYVTKETDDYSLELLKDILTPYSSLVPKTISVSDGIIYVTCESSPTLFMYNMKYEAWYSLTLPFSVGAMASGSMFKPATFRGFFFIGNMKLFVTNFNATTKYRIGQKSSNILIHTIDQAGVDYTYDDRFVTIDETGINCHTGYIAKELTSIGDNIYSSEYFNKSNDYRNIIKYDITFREEDEDGQE
jgi:hypothetical protein